MNDVTVIIPIFGDVDHWTPMAVRAQRSAWAQTVEPVSVVISVADTLSVARNRAAGAARTEWLCFLDADDELDPGYIEAMLCGTGDLRQPATLGVVDGVEDAFPVLIPSKPLLDGNYIVIGAFVRREIFESAGGFTELPAYEDWDLWIRCWLHGAVITTCPDAIYRVHVRPDSRNQLDREAAVRSYNFIRNRYVRRTPKQRTA